MQITKFSLALAITGAGLLWVHAQPLTPTEQQNAVELLRQKLTEERQKKSAPAPAAKPAAPVQSLEQQKAIEALRQKLAEERQKPSAPAAETKPAKPVQPSRSAEFQAPKPAPKPAAPAVKPAPKAAPAVAPKPAPAPAPKAPLAVATKPKVEPKAAPAPQPVAQAESRPARTLWDGLKKAFPQKKSAGVEPKQAGGVVAAPGKAVPPARAATVPAAKVALEKPAAPARVIPVPAAPAGLTPKQQRLADLLEMYKTDKVSPAEYHEQRAKILAEP